MNTNFLLSNFFNNDVHKSVKLPEINYNSHLFCIIQTKLNMEHNTMFNTPDEQLTLLFNICPWKVV
jgi:hypothetical protein